MRHTPEQRARISARQSAAQLRRFQNPEERAKISASKTGPNHPRWSGDRPSYQAVHKRVKKRKGMKRVCEHCGQEGRTELANISGRYLDDVNDYKELCKPCHRVFDGR